ncbi:DnaA/Hda family protein [Paralimibaculum aggregatum]|uniref:DnaA/Hda family protein n=1 Tax=Paralimibaculum aggregatum TaxID=3036245 RepID=A0ABQ6LE93_9RHOB|nr:chromosomal replication initiator DnaA [Limibaculum sp. NKW23]GMG81664.1 DnaA/Hda family protein [Limibaculum sp. NKW23]
MTGEGEPRPQQLVLPVAGVRPPAQGREDYLVSDSNRAAITALDAAWPENRLALIGPPGCGKTHLARVWAAERGAVLRRAAALEPGEVAALAGGPVAVEDVDRLHAPETGAAPAQAADRAVDPAAAERALLHLYNLAAANRQPLLLTGRRAPTQWRIALPDLASRLATLALAEISPPDDALLSSLVIKLCADRQLRVGPKVVTRLMRGIERSHAGVAQMVAALDEVSLTEGRTITPQLATEILNRMKPD